MRIWDVRCHHFLSFRLSFDCNYVDGEILEVAGEESCGVHSWF